MGSWSCGSKCSAVVTDVTVCNGDHTKAFVGKWENKCLVSFEGTSDIASFIKDLEFVQAATDWSGCSGCKVHGGFLDEYNSVKKCVQTALLGTGCSLGSKIRTTGHSLGAAMNSIQRSILRMLVGTSRSRMILENQELAIQILRKLTTSCLVEGHGESLMRRIL